MHVKFEVRKVRTIEIFVAVDIQTKFLMHWVRTPVFKNCFHTDFGVLHQKSPDEFYFESLNLCQIKYNYSKNFIQGFVCNMNYIFVTFLGTFLI